VVEDFSVTRVAHNLSCVMVYNVGHIIGLPMSNHAIHLPTILTVISLAK
jgi:hypothetical protein